MALTSSRRKDQPICNLTATAASSNTAPTFAQGRTGCIHAASVSPLRVGTAFALVETIFALT